MSLKDLNLIPDTDEQVSVSQRPKPVRQLSFRNVDPPIRPTSWAVIPPSRPVNQPVVHMPRFQSQRVSELAQDMPPTFKISSCGKWSELWTDDAAKRVAVIRRSDRRVLIFDNPAWDNAFKYLAIAHQRGVNKVQATDIICHSLTK